MRTAWLLATIIVSTTSGCVTDAPTADDAGVSMVDETAALLPWAVGNSWTYRVTDSGNVSTKTTTIEAEALVGGSGPQSDQMAFRVTTLKTDGTDHTVSWQRSVDGKVVRYREQAFAAATDQVTAEEHWDPYKLHVDGTAEHTVAGASWLEAYTETKLPTAGTATTSTEHDRWTVDQTGAQVTVPAGTFTNAIVLTKAGGSALKSYWYVRGIGKVKETGGQTEELVSYEVSP